MKLFGLEASSWDYPRQKQFEGNTFQACAQQYRMPVISFGAWSDLEPEY
jgi:hypothetical protein